MRGKRRAQGLQKMKELEKKVMALEDAIKVDVRTISRMSRQTFFMSTSHQASTL